MPFNASLSIASTLSPAAIGFTGLLNVNREFYLSCQSLLAALADALLDTHSATDFESLPTGA